MALVVSQGPKHIQKLKKLLEKVQHGFIEEVNDKIANEIEKIGDE